jgi:hypothetical protein
MRNLRKSKKEEEKEEMSKKAERQKQTQSSRKITVKNRQRLTPEEEEEYQSLLKEEIEEKKKIEKEIEEGNSPNGKKAEKLRRGVCGICFENIVTQGVLDECPHTFCWECIKEWGEIENTCPCCKRRFHKIKRKLPRAESDSLLNPSKRKKKNSLPKGNTSNSKTKEEDEIEIQTKNQRTDDLSDDPILLNSLFREQLSNLVEFINSQPHIPRGIFQFIYGDSDSDSDSDEDDSEVVPERRLLNIRISESISQLVEEHTIPRNSRISFLIPVGSWDRNPFAESPRANANVRNSEEGKLEGENGNRVELERNERNNNENEDNPGSIHNDLINEEESSSENSVFTENSDSPSVEISDSSQSDDPDFTLSQHSE